MSGLVFPLHYAMSASPTSTLRGGGHQPWSWAGGSPSCSTQLYPLATTRASDGGQTTLQACLPSALTSCLYCLPWHKQVLWVCKKKCI